MGLSVAAVDTSERKLEIARELGADVAVAAEGAGRALQKRYGGLDGAIVLTASVAAIQEAFKCLKRTGVLVLVGLTNDRFELPVLDTILKGITVRGSYLGTRQDLEEVFRLADRVRCAPARGNARAGGSPGAAGDDASRRTDRPRGDHVLRTSHRSPLRLETAVYCQTIS